MKNRSRLLLATAAGALGLFSALGMTRAQMNRGELSAECQGVAVSIGVITGDHLSGSCHGFLCEMLDALAEGDINRYRAAKISFKDAECPGYEHLNRLLEGYGEGLTPITDVVDDGSSSVDGSYDASLVPQSTLLMSESSGSYSTSVSTTRR